MRIALLIISIISSICVITLFVLHFTIDLDAIWFSIATSCASISSLMLSIANLKMSRKNAQQHGDKQH